MTALAPPATPAIPPHTQAPTLATAPTLAKAPPLAKAPALAKAPPLADAPAAPRAPQGHAQAMDRIYRHQRYIYDLTRRYYLFGRDTLLRQMHLREGDRVLEVGCGTARNLLKLAALKPCHLYGLDASAEMLVTARANVTSAKLACRIALARCYAEDLTPANPFGLPCPFDAIFFSYSLSMIPTWPAALDAAMTSLRPGGSIYIVDFYDQASLPRWFQLILKRWLALFHVEHRPELLTRLREIAADGRGTLHLHSLAGRYAYIARLTLPS